MPHLSSSFSHAAKNSSSHLMGSWFRQKPDEKKETSDRIKSRILSPAVFQGAVRKNAEHYLFLMNKCDVRQTNSTGSSHGSHPYLFDAIPVAKIDGRRHKLKSQSVCLFPDLGPQVGRFLGGEVGLYTRSNGARRWFACD